MLRFKKSVFSTAYIYIYIYIYSVSHNVIVVYELVRMCKKWLWPVLRCCTTICFDRLCKTTEIPS